MKKTLPLLLIYYDFQFDQEHKTNYLSCDVLRHVQCLVKSDKFT